MWLKWFDAFMRWFFRHINVEIYVSPDVMCGNLVNSPPQVKMLRYDWTAEETESLLKTIKEKNKTTTMAKVT